MQGIEAFFALINEVADGVAQKRHSVNWLVTVDHGSALITAKPDSTQFDDHKFSLLTESLHEELQALKKGSRKRPKFFSDHALEAAKSLGGIRDAKQRTITDVEIIFDNTHNSFSTKPVASVDEIIGESHQAIGSIEGILDVVSKRKSFHCFVYDALTDKSVYCDISEDSETICKEVLNAFNSG